MRIGLISGEYPPMQGGVGDFTRALGRALVRLGHEVWVLTAARARPQAADSVRVEARVAGWGWGVLEETLRWAHGHALEVVNLQYQAGAYGLGLPVHLTTWWWQKRRARFASVVTYHDLRVPYLFPKAGAWRRRAVFALGQAAARVIVTNEEDERAWAPDTAGWAPGEPGAQWVERIPIGSNIEPHLPADYAREIWRGQYGIKPDDLLLGYFGFLNASKGGEVLLEALAGLVAAGRAAYLLLIGGTHGASDPTDVAYAAQFEARAAALGVAGRVVRTGFLENDGVSAALRAVDVMTLPYRDGLSLRRGSLMAALAHGCAIVTTRAAERVEPAPEADFVVRVPVDDAVALAAAVMRLADAPAERAALGRRAEQCAQAFGWDAIAARTVAVYQAACVAGRVR